MSKTEPTLAEFEQMSVEEKKELSQSIRESLEQQKAMADKAIADVAEAEAIKKKYPEKTKRGVFLLQVGDARAWLKNIDRTVIAMVTATADDPIESTELVLENLWLEGDERLKDDDDYFIPAIQQLKGLMRIQTGSLKKF